MPVHLLIPNRLETPMPDFTRAAASWLSGAVLLTSTAFSATATAGVGTDGMPDEPAFAAPLAATIEAHNYISWVHYKPEQGENIGLGMVAVGMDFPFVGGTLNNGSRWTFGLFADFQAEFDMDQNNQPLLNQDYFVGFPLSWQGEQWGARFRLFHQSSHLGDELLLSENPPERENLSYEAADFLVSYNVMPTWRIYGGGTWILRKQWDALHNLGSQIGTEWISQKTVALGAHAVVSGDVRWFEAFSDDPQRRALAGLRWVSQNNSQRSATVAMTLFEGAVPFGQFFNYRATFYGMQVFFRL